MKIRFLLALVGLAISIALPTFAQQTNTPDPQLRQVVDTIDNKFDEAFDTGNAAPFATLYTKDAILVTNHGPISGLEALGKYYTDLFKAVQFSNSHSKADPDSPHVGATGNEMWATGEWSNTVKGANFGPVDQKGYWSALYVREGDTWKKQLLTWNITPAPPK